jgi:hypothetical protein
MKHKISTEYNTVTHLYIGQKHLQLIQRIDIILSRVTVTKYEARIGNWIY